MGSSPTNTAVFSTNVLSSGKGFTLVEVIIAITILFVVLMSGTLAYRSSAKLLRKLDIRVQIEDAALTVREPIRAELEDGNFQGDGVAGKKIRYEWQATKERSGRNVLAGRSEFDPNQKVYGRFVLTLYNVRLKLFSPEAEDAQFREFIYSELLWREEEVPEFIMPR